MTADTDKGAQPEQAPSPVQRETDEGQPIIPGAEITLPEEEGGEATITEQEEGALGQNETEQAGEGRQPATPQRGKNRVPAKQRINQLWHEARQAETRAEQLERENAELKRQMEEGASSRKQVDTAALAAHERAVTAERDLAMRELIDAKTAADPAKEAAATGKLSRAEAELGNISAWKAANPPPAKTNGAAQPEQPKPNANGAAQPQPVEVSPEIQEWVGKNLWAVNDPRNPEFDPEMANFMANQANILEMRMRRQGRTAEIGGPTYFDEIDKLMREEFPDRFDDTQEEDDQVAAPQPRPQPRQQPANQRRAPQMARQNGAAPVAAASQSAGQATQRAQPRTVNLSAEERQFAHNNAANGAYRYPVGHKMAGKPMSAGDAEVHYARFKLDDMKANAHRRGGN